MAKIVIAGYMIRHPVGGNVWAYLHYVMGLDRLHHDVAYVEESGWPGSCYNPRTGLHGDDPRAGLEFVHNAAADHGLDIPILYVDRAGAVHGGGRDQLRVLLEEADLLINLGRCWLPEFRLCRRRALVDLDPFFTQIGTFGDENLHEHNVHFTYGANIGRPHNMIPTQGIRWHATVPPVVPNVWTTTPGEEPSPSPDRGVFTTVANWAAYGGVTYEGEHYGQKNEEFLEMLDLPRLTNQKLEIALSGADPSVQESLRRAGWRVEDGNAISADMGSYQTYIVSSRGEFSVAKNGYVKSRSGWFSDRTVCYLAAGRPAILQDTGFSEWLPSGEGVLGFSTLDGAANCLEEVNADYSTHSRAARDLASEYFGYGVILPRLLEIALN